MGGNRWPSGRIVRNKGIRKWNELTEDDRVHVVKGQEGKRPEVTGLQPGSIKLDGRKKEGKTEMLEDTDTDDT